MADFVDTNVFVYARDTSEPAKREAASRWIEHLWATREGRLSWQVLQEYYVTVTQKLTPGLDASVARADVRDLTAWRPVSVTTAIVGSAWSLQDRHSISFWDALIVAAAEAAGCEQVITEDLTDGATLGSVRVVNPFAHAPS